MCHQEFGEEFTEHAVFLCSNKHKIQHLPDGKYIVLAAFSTENLLMNAYITSNRLANTCYICIDASCQYMFEGYGFLVVKTVNYGQSRHTIGYGLVLHEDEDTCVFVLECLKKKQSMS